MTRQQKYPETRTFHYHNANPKNRMTGDCVYRAISVALGQTWEQTMVEMAALSCKHGFSPVDTKGIDKYMEHKGWKRRPQPRKADGTKYTGAEWCEQLQEDIKWATNGDQLTHIVANIGGHHTVAIIDGKVWDTWNSTGGCIGSYWVKRTC